MRIPASDINAVISSAHVGSPFLFPPAKIDRNGMTLSLAIACNNLGAPVSDWRPAPIVDKNAPINIKLAVGQTNKDATILPPWPY